MPSVKHAIERHAVRGDQLAERLAVDELEGQERNAVRFLDRVDGDDVRMIERGGGACLALEAFAAVGIAASRR